MGVFAQVRRKRSALVGASILTVSAVAITTMALAYDGYPTVEADLNDGGVWLTKTSSLLVGHFNHQSAVLDGGLRTKGDDYDIAQAGRTVLVVDGSNATVTAVDPAQVKLLGSANIPGGASVSLGADTVAILEPKDGALWVSDVDSIESFNAAAIDPITTLGKGAVATVGTDGTVEEVAALIEPVPDPWLPDFKRDVQVRLQLLRAGQATATATARRDAVRRAFAMAKTPMQVMDSTCVSRVRVDIATEVILASGMQDRFADELLAYGMWKHDLAFIDAVMPFVTRIDGPNEAMQGGAPLCSAAVLMDAQIFERLLKAKADPAKRCGDGKTVRELLTERATRANAEPQFNASNRALLKVLDRYDRGG